MTVLTAEVRKDSGKGVARKLRREDKVPAVVYGMKKDAQSIALSVHELKMALNKGGFFSNVVELEFGDHKESVLARDVQHHPVKDLPLHVDFVRFDPKRRIVVTLPLVVVGEEECPGLEEGGILQMIHNELEVKCRIGKIPSQLEVSIAGKEIGDTVAISDIQLPEEGEFIDEDTSIAVLSILQPAKEEPVEAEETEEVAADEVEATEQSSDESEGGDKDAE